MTPGTTTRKSPSGGAARARFVRGTAVVRARPDHALVGCPQQASREPSPRPSLAHRKQAWARCSRRRLFARQHPTRLPAAARGALLAGGAGDDHLLPTGAGRPSGSTAGRAATRRAPARQAVLPAGLRARDAGQLLEARDRGAAVVGRRHVALRFPYPRSWRRAGRAARSPASCSWPASTWRRRRGSGARPPRPAAARRVPAAREPHDPPRRGRALRPEEARGRDNSRGGYALKL